VNRVPERGRSFRHHPCLAGSPAARVQQVDAAGTRVP